MYRKQQKKRQKDADRETVNKNRAMFEDEGALVQKIFTVTNNAVVVSIGHGIEPPGVSHQAVSPILRLGPGEETGTGGTDTERSFLSHILLDRLAFP